MIIGKEKNWKNVRKKKRDDNLFLIYLDEKCLKSDQGNNIKLPAQLADEVVREWNADGKIDSIKNSFFTKLCFKCRRFSPPTYLLPPPITSSQNFF